MKGWRLGTAEAVEHAETVMGLRVTIRRDGKRKRDGTRRRTVTVVDERGHSHLFSRVRHFRAMVADDMGQRQRLLDAAEEALLGTAPQRGGDDQ